MPRLLNRGTPNRTKRYVFPGLPAKRLFWGSLGAGGALLALLAVLHVAGALRVASPGPLASGHASLDSRCEECHAHGVASDLRCERCHDAAGMDSWRVAEHARFGREASSFPAASSHAEKALARHEIRCAECHTDHRGRGFKMNVVADVTCKRCHAADTPSLARHAEFALVKAKATPPRGLEISHGRHVLEAFARMRKKPSAKELTDAEKAMLNDDPALLQRTCETCHVVTSDLTSFEPIDFDRHCASCHMKDGVLEAPTDSMNALVVLAPEQIRASWAPAFAGQMKLMRGRISKSAVIHQDPWVLFNMAKIRREVEPAAAVWERTALLSDINDAERHGSAFPLARASRGDLVARLAELDVEIKGLKAAGAAAERKALADGAALFGAVAAALAPEAGAPLSAVVPSVAAGPLAALPAGDAAARRAELLAALDVLRARAEATSDLVLGRRVDMLRRRVVRWKPGTSGDGVAEALAERLDERARVADELDYRKKARVATSPRGSEAADRKRLESRAEDATQRLQGLALVDAIPLAPVDQAGLDARKEAIAALAAPCIKCHKLEGAALAAMKIDQPVMPRSIFNHKPHTKLASCASCHAAGGKGALVSKKAVDVLVPDVTSCRKCHRPGETRYDCTTCHRFHPQGMRGRPDEKHPSTSLVAGGFDADAPTPASPGSPAVVAAMLVPGHEVQR